MKRTITWLEGKKSDCSSLIAALRNEGYIVETASSVKAVIERTHVSSQDLIVAHLPSLRMGSKRIETSFRDNVNKTPILFLNNHDQTDSQEKEAADNVIFLPCSSRKLLNRVHGLVPGVIKAGSLSLDLEKNIVASNGSEKPLTPRLTSLLLKLMQHSGEVIERKKLFSEVWHTDYTNDTRTLDVHISWLRQAIEVDPKKPKMIITVRGMGYRLDV